MGTTQKAYADAMVVTLEGGHWVARFYLNGQLQWTQRSKQPAADDPRFAITNVRFALKVK